MEDRPVAPNIFLSSSFRSADRELLLSRIRRDVIRVPGTSFTAPFLHVFPHHPVSTCSSDGNLIANGSSDGTVYVTRTDVSAERYLEGHRGDITDLAFSHDGTLLASASN